MEGLLSAIERGALFFVVTGGIIATLFLVFSGIQYATSGGEPQRVSQARSSFFGVLVGLLILGMSLVLPRLLGELVVLPVGGIAPQSSRSAQDCDSFFKAYLELHPSAYDADGMNTMARRLQYEREECRSELWDPYVLGPDPVASTDEEIENAEKRRRLCFTITPANPDADPPVLSDPPKIYNIQLPADLVGPNGWDPLGESHRDRFGNILVYFEDGRLPHDGKYCWVYFAGLNGWFSGPGE